jgi:cytochrome P450
LSDFYVLNTLLVTVHQIVRLFCDACRSNRNFDVTLNITVHILSRLPYNEAFLREVLRKETLVPLSLVHRATEDTELGGYSIPKVSNCKSIFLNLSKAYINLKGAFVNWQ